MQRLTAGAMQLGLNLLPVQLAAFESYSQELLAWNEMFNLTAITDPEQVEIRHFLDSLSLIPALAAHEGITVPALLARTPHIVDIGAGAGFPGLALRIVWPRARFVLLEATAKKVRFLEHIAGKLGFSDVQLVHGRAEELGLREPHRAGFDLVVARAVASLPTLVEYLLPFSKRGGRVVAYKGSAAHEEAMCSEEAIRTLGGRLTKLIPVEVPGLAETRVLVLMDKIAQTPEGYPRGRGLPRKRPLGCQPNEEAVEEI
jgi:16S rRNA (guanine527-N7)-methyltransferase